MNRTILEKYLIKELFMSDVVNNFTAVLHRIRVKLYPNYLPHVEGAYLAKTSSEDVLSIEDICTSMIGRGGYSGKHEELVRIVKQYFNESAYQLCDGYAVNTGFYSIHPNIGGTFDSPNDVPDLKKNPVDFRFRIRGPLRSLIQHIRVDIAGIADGNAYIHEFIDTDEQSTNDLFVPGDLFCLYGNKIKIAGDNKDCGLYFVSDNKEAVAVKVKRIL